ncbi:MAG: Glyoxalase/bleomycin resistance protein/dioxygenase [Actinomycetia bacterium]|nr:Glyoxalase/bleomycin resistance protein/dioxygenase [Actinomycetes bacterium]
MPKREIAPIGAPCWIDVFTSKPEATRSFYCDLFGWTFEQGAEEFGGYSTFFSDGVQVAGFMPNHGDVDTPDMWSVYLAVEDAKATVDAVVAHGGQVYAPAMDVGDLGVMAVLADNGGAAVGIWEPKEHKGFGVLAETGAPGWFELFTRDHAKVVKFYEDVFGWDTTAVGDSDEFRYTTLGKDEAALAGVMDASSFLPEGVPAHWSVYFVAEDTDASIAKATGLGATLVQGPDDTPYGRLATLTDPTGAGFKLMGPNKG